MYSVTEPSFINWITLTRKSDKHCAQHTEPLDSCFDLIRSCRWVKVFLLFIYGPRQYYVDFMYIEDKGLVVMLPHKFNVEVLYKYSVLEKRLNKHMEKLMNE